MKNTKVKLEVKKLGTFTKNLAKVFANDTGDPTTVLLTTKTTVGVFPFEAKVLK